jgi:hypothetical protein
VTLRSVEGDNLTGLVGNALTDSVGAVVLDAYGNPIPGETVSWHPLPLSGPSFGNPGSVSPAVSATDSQGVARTAWTLGTKPASQTLTAQCGAITRTATATGTLGSWDWQPVSTPILGEFQFWLSPVNDQILFVIENTGGITQRTLWRSPDAGVTWVPVLSSTAIALEALEFDTSNPQHVLAGTVTGDLHESFDAGATWSLLNNLPGRNIVSVDIGAFDGHIYVGPGPIYGSSPGLYRSVDGGQSFSFLPYGIADTLLPIPWDIEQSPLTGAIFVPTEYANHMPFPYDPPFFRSVDGGTTWTDVSGPWWHGVKVIIDSLDNTLYLQLEGPGIRRSEDNGETWVNTGQEGVELHLDQGRPNRLFLAWFHFTGNLRPGGAYMSVDRTDTFGPIGFVGQTVYSVVATRDGSMAYANVSSAGLFRALILPDLP